MRTVYKVVDLSGDPVSLQAFSTPGTIDLEILDVRLSVERDAGGFKEDVITFTLLYRHDKMPSSVQNKLLMKRMGHYE